MPRVTEPARPVQVPWGLREGWCGGGVPQGVLGSICLPFSLLSWPSWGLLSPMHNTSTWSHLPLLPPLPLWPIKAHLKSGTVLIGVEWGKICQFGAEKRVVLIFSGNWMLAGSGSLDQIFWNVSKMYKLVYLELLVLEYSFLFENACSC